MSPPRSTLKLLLTLHLLTGTLLLCSLAVDAQAQPIADDTAPPPLKFVSKSELSRLDTITDVKKRTQAALELMSVRLKNAESLRTQDQLDLMNKELGSFHGLMDNTLGFLDRSDKDSNRVLNNYKRFEIGLRQFRPRLEVLRRDIPLRYEPYLRNLIIYLRDARAKAIEPMFSDSVVPRIRPANPQ